MKPAPTTPAPAAACDHDDRHCVTCSDEAIVVRVVAAADDDLSRCVDAAGAEHEVATDLVGAVSPGDRLLVHAGVALLRVEDADPAEAS